MTIAMTYEADGVNPRQPGSGSESGRAKVTGSESDRAKAKATGSDSGRALAQASGLGQALARAWSRSGRASVPPRRWWLADCCCWGLEWDRV